MQSATPSTSDVLQNDEMQSLQSVEQADPEINVEKDADLVQVIDTVQTADYMPINTKKQCKQHVNHLYRETAAESYRSWRLHV